MSQRTNCETRRGLKMAQRFMAGALGVFSFVPALAGDVVGVFGVPVPRGDFENDFETKAWVEVATQLPPPPAAHNLIPFYVSAATEHRFFIDPASISVGKDGVVRYTVVIETSGGANNTSYEGMRCQTREWRHYASGHRSGGWSKARNVRWDKVRDGGPNSYQATLFLEHFCPDGIIVTNDAAARNSFLGARQSPGPATGVYIGR